MYLNAQLYVRRQNETWEKSNKLHHLFSIHFTSLNLYAQYLLRPQEGAVNAFSTTAGFTVNAKTTGTTEVLCTH